MGAALLCAAALAPLRDGVRVFAWNAAYWAIPEALALGLLLALRARPGVLGGVALGWSAFLVPLWAWARSQPPQTLSVLMYVYAIPGGWIGAVVAGLAARARPGRSGLRAGVVAGVTVAAGLELCRAVAWAVAARPG